MAVGIECVFLVGGRNNSYTGVLCKEETANNETIRVLLQTQLLASSVSIPSFLSALPPPPTSSPVRGVTEEQVAGGKAQDEEDLLQDHLPAQVTHQIPLGT